MRNIKIDEAYDSIFLKYFLKFQLSTDQSDPSWGRNYIFVFNEPDFSNHFLNFFNCWDVKYNVEQLVLQFNFTDCENYLLF